MRSHPLRKIIFPILEKSLPLNTCQVCRLANGAKGKHDINFCTSGIRDEWQGESNFKSHDNKPYPNCKDHKYQLRKIHYHLSVLETRDLVESRIEFRKDPHVIGRKDRMRMWALKGRLPSLDKWVYPE